ncbi:hypothetical protein ASPBRDRAFT_48231, partial [Aspergillus brasiliensis CBS 101740]
MNKGYIPLFMMIQGDISLLAWLVWCVSVYQTLSEKNMEVKDWPSLPRMAGNGCLLVGRPR